MKFKIVLDIEGSPTDPSHMDPHEVADFLMPDVPTFTPGNHFKFWFPGEDGVMQEHRGLFVSAEWEG